MRELTSFDIYTILTYDNPKIQQILKQIDGKGSFPTHIDNNVSIPAAYVVNNDWYFSKGIHWFLIFFRDDCTIVVDSFAIPISWFNIVFMTRRNNLPLIQNTFELQERNSQCCGHYVVYFLFGLAQGYSLVGNSLTGEYGLLDPFINSNPSYNDLFVYNFLKTLIWKKKIPINI